MNNSPIPEPSFILQNKINVAYTPMNIHSLLQKMS